MSIFKENLTSRVIQKAALEILLNCKQNEMKILEIGCGDGNITKFLIEKTQSFNFDFSCSDISSEAIKKAKSNLKNFKCNIKVGKYLEPWNGKKYDLIISDVSSISDDVAEKSEWYKGVVCDSGKDGLKNLIFIIDAILNYLKPNGVFILPIISLCNVDKLKSMLNLKFSQIIYSDKISWPLPEFFKNNLVLFSELKNQNLIDFENKFGISMAFTYAAICKR